MFLAAVSTQASRSCRAEITQSKASFPIVLFVQELPEPSGLLAAAVKVKCIVGYLPAQPQHKSPQFAAWASDQAQLLCSLLRPPRTPA